MRIKLPSIPTAGTLRDEIERRRGEIQELKELLRIAEVRELRDRGLPQRNRPDGEKWGARHGD